MNPNTSLSLRQGELALEKGRRIAAVSHNDFHLEARLEGEDLWVIFSREPQDGGLGWHVSLLSSEVQVEKSESSGLLGLIARSSLGTHTIEIEADPSEAAMFSLTVSFRPESRLHLPYLPRDLVAIGPKGRIDRPKGRIEARQRRLNTGFCYFSLDEPDFGKVLYLQDLTALNGYFQATGTKPENAVGGEWPEVGYLPPTHPDVTTRALPGRRKTVLCRAFLLIRRFPAREEAASAWQFLDMLAATYARIERPPCVHRDWLDRSRRTLSDLSSSAKARTRHGGHTYFHPYTAAENPDSMVQLSLLHAIREWGRWNAAPSPLEREAFSGIRRFYDAKLGALRRYLPDVGAEKDADAVDSWYLYHPMGNLAALALDGEEEARRLFFDVIEYGIKTARHFNYRWPIQYKIDTFEVITEVAADDRGQTDVGGMYAWVMLQAFTLSGESRYLDEAKAAIAAAEGMRFDLNYQANLTAWGAVACIKLWRITGERHFLEQSYVYLASFFHNCQIWRSRIELAKHYNNFLAVTCLQDAPYMAIYECFDSFAAFEKYLDLGGPDLIPSAKLLVSEYCRYALDRAWFYYPDALPKDGVAHDNIRNGHIDRTLSFPVEDLYPDGQPAGQVGQEIYGAGAAMIFATRAFHRLDDAPFLLHSDHFVRAITRIDEKTVGMTLDGPAGLKASISLIAVKPRRSTPTIILRGSTGQMLRPRKRAPHAICEFRVPSQGVYTLSW